MKKGRKAYEVPAMLVHQMKPTRPLCGSGSGSGTGDEIIIPIPGQNSSPNSNSTTDFSSWRHND